MVNPSKAVDEDASVMRQQIRAFLAAAPRPDGLRNYGPTPTDDDVAPADVPVTESLANVPNLFPEIGIAQ